MFRTARYVCLAALLACLLGALIGAGVVGYAKRPLQDSPQLCQLFEPVTFNGRRLLRRGRWRWLYVSMAPVPLDRWVRLAPHVSPAPLPSPPALSSTWTK